MNLSLKMSLGAVVLGLASLATAASTPFAGALTVNDPTFNRPQAGNPPTLLSAIGTSTSYDVFAFYVTAPDTYTLQTHSAAFAPGAADDTFIVLYQNTFAPATALANALQANDDNGASSLSLVAHPLSPGIQYFLVVTSYINGAFGNYTGSISNAGAGEAVLGAVPEPSSALMMLAALGVGGLAAARRRA